MSFTVASAVTAAVVKRYKPEFAIIATVAAVFAASVAALTAFTPVLTLLHRLSSPIDNGDEYLAILLKCAGAVILSALAHDICKDCGETALARTAELIGAVSVLVFSLPVFTKLFELAVGYIPL